MNNNESSKKTETIDIAINRILDGLVQLGIKCAVRRNINKISVPYVSDVDILIGGKHVDSIIKVITEITEIIRMKLSYGGLKVWIRTPEMFIKELDFLWRVSKWGIILLDTEDLIEILNRHTIIDGHIPVLSPEGMGKLIFAEKTTKEDMAKYSFELQQAGVTQISAQAKMSLFLKKIALSPLHNMKSIIVFILLRGLRFIYPVGITIYYQIPIKDNEDIILKYLFDKRIYSPRSAIGRIYRRNIMGGLVFVRCKKDADLIIDGNDFNVADKIIDFQIKNRKKLSKLQILLA